MADTRDTTRQEALESEQGAAEHSTRCIRSAGQQKSEQDALKVQGVVNIRHAV
jgi:hypothetical protein